MGKAIVVIVIILILLIAIASYFVYANLFSNISNNIVFTNKSSINQTEVGIEQVNYLLYNLGANNLHNPPFSSDTPKIEIVVGDDVFTSEVISGKINTFKKTS